MVIVIPFNLNWLYPQIITACVKFDEFIVHNQVVKYQ